MTVIDVDSHFEPGPSWLDAHPGLRERLPPFDTAEVTTKIIAGDILADVPRDEWPSWDELAPPGIAAIAGREQKPDDYGYEGLRNVLMTRLQMASDVRYSMRYMTVRQNCNGELKSGCRAAVDVMIDASFTITNAVGQPKRPDKRDQNELILEWDGRRWLFLAGM